MFLSTIRGATTVNVNIREEIIVKTKELLLQIIKENNIETEDILSIVFTSTKDLDSAYPAISARELGIVNASLMCMQEMYVAGSLEKCIRVMMTAYTDKNQKNILHIYSEGAKILRPDIVIKSSNNSRYPTKLITIAVDGPVGSGKSTVSKTIAKALNITYVDTGAMYRAIALHCINNDIEPGDEENVINNMDNINIKINNMNNTQHIYLNDEDVTDKIRNQEVAGGSSKVAGILRVREKLVEIQRKIAAGNNVIMDGRDIGTHVLKDAKLKIYLDASVDIRTKRRCGELKEKNLPFDFDTVKQEITERDNYDMNRVNFPLKQAEDAVFIDTSNLEQKEVIEAILAICRVRFRL